MNKGIMKYKRIVLYTLASILIICFLYLALGKYLKPYINPIFIKSWVLSYGRFGFIAFIILQMVQVLIFIIPGSGEIVLGAGGFIFGTAIGTVLSLCGIILGSIIAFLTARLYGDKLLIKVLPEKEYIKVKSLIDRPNNRFIIFVLFLIPGFPKDILDYASGVTPIGLGEFILISTIARLPGVILASYMGSTLYHKNYRAAIVMLMIMAVLLIIGILKGRKIMERIR